MSPVLLFIFLLIVFLYIIGIISRRSADAARNEVGRPESPGSGGVRYETEPEDETPGIEWEVTEGEAMLRQLVDHCKENPGEVSKLVKTWIVSDKNS